MHVRENARGGFRKNSPVLAIEHTKVIDSTFNPTHNAPNNRIVSTAFERANPKQFGDAKPRDPQGRPGCRKGAGCTLPGTEAVLWHLCPCFILCGVRALARTARPIALPAHNTTGTCSKKTNWGGNP